MLSAETGGEVTLLVGVVDGYFGFEGDFTRKPEGTPDFRHEENFGGALEDVFPGCLRWHGMWFVSGENIGIQSIQLYSTAILSLGGIEGA